MAFNSKRGRPRSARPMSDAGTPELAMKRAFRFTAEPIDICLERELITAEQHWCAVHLRWLYTIRFGAPDVHAIDPTHLGGIEIRVNDSEWQAMREAELTDAFHRLQEIKAHQLVLRLCVHNEFLAFIRHSLRRIPLTIHEEHELYKVREGLDLLRAIWGKQKAQQPKSLQTEEV